MEKSWSSVPKNYKGEHEILELEVIIKNEKEINSLLPFHFLLFILNF